MTGGACRFLGRGEAEEVARCEIVVLDPGTDPHEDNRPLWRRLEMLGIESGRLGSERL